MKKNLNKIVILGMLVFGIFVNPAQAKEQICGNLASIVYYPQANPPKIGCLYAYNTYGQTPFWLQVKQVVNGGILVSADDAGIYHYGFHNAKDIYIQTSKQFVDGQILKDKEIVKFMGYYDYITVLGARKRVYKFYRYGKYEIEKNVDTFSLEKYGFIEPKILPQKVDENNKKECIWNIISIATDGACTTYRDDKAEDLDRKIESEIESEFLKSANVTYRQWLYSEFYKTDSGREIKDSIEKWKAKLSSPKSYYEKTNDPEALIQIYFYNEILDAIKGLKPDIRYHDGTISRSNSKMVYYNFLGKKYHLPIIDMDICRKLYNKGLIKVFPYRLIYFYNKAVEQEYLTSKPNDKVIENHLQRQNKKFEAFVNSYEVLKELNIIQDNSNEPISTEETDEYFKLLKEAEENFKNSKDQVPSKRNDLKFRKFLFTYWNTIENINEIAKDGIKQLSFEDANRAEDFNEWNPRAQKLAKYYENNGISVIYNGEGYFVATVKTDYLTSFYKYLTPEYKNWLNFEKQIETEVGTQDNCHRKVYGIVKEGQDYYNG